MVAIKDVVLWDCYCQDVVSWDCCCHEKYPRRQWSSVFKKHLTQQQSINNNSMVTDKHDCEGIFARGSSLSVMRYILAASWDDS
jgi:hypothetical protein